MTDDVEPREFLPDSLLERIRSRAPEIDRENGFPNEDLEDLHAAGYLRILVPTTLGGAGLTLSAASRLQARLAAHAPATALAVNMHLVWTAVARILRERGDDGLEWLLRATADDDELFAFGLSEPGNERVLFDSRTSVTPLTNGGYAFSGTKIFTSLAPAWTSLGVHGKDSTDPEHPTLVFGFVKRDKKVATRDDWHALGMRGTQSRTTELRGATAPPERTVRVIDPAAGPDPLQFAIFAAFELLIASVYTGIARRAVELTADAVRSRVSPVTGEPRSSDPVVRDRIGELALDLDGMELALTALTRDVDADADHGARWYALLSGMKHRASATAQRLVDEAATLVGGASFRHDHELARLARDVRAGAHHPSSRESARQTAASVWLDE